MDLTLAISQVEDDEVKLPDNILEAAGLEKGQMVKIEVIETPEGKKEIVISAEGAKPISLEALPNNE